MTIDVGDEITWGGVDYEVISQDVTRHGYWIKNLNGVDYHFITMKFIYDNTFTDVLRMKRKREPASLDCCHNWVRYKGARIVQDYCTKCDRKRDVDWRDLKDE